MREQVSALRDLLVLSTLLTRQDSQAGILDLVVDAVASLGPWTAQGIFLDGRWQDVRLPGREPGSAILPDVVIAAVARGPAAAGGPVSLPGVPWSWAYSLSSPYGPSGYLVVGAGNQPPEGGRFLLQALAQQAGAALAKARLHRREREEAAELRIVNLTLGRNREIHDRLTKVADEDEGPDGIAQALYELTDRPAAIEDRFGNLRAWAGPGRPDPYPKDDADQRDRLLRRLVTAAGPVRAGQNLMSVALLAGAPVGVVFIRDPDATAGGSERMAIEHAATVLAMRVARMRTWGETDTRLRINLVLDIIAGTGADRPAVLSRAQTLGYDLGRAHRVVVVNGRHGDDEVNGFFDAVSRAARAVMVGSLLAPRLNDVVVLADPEAPWEQFRQHVVAELHGGHCQVGVGGRCTELDEFPRSYQEAQLALRIQITAGGDRHVTLFDDLGVYKVLATANDMSALERFVGDWLGPLIRYDSVHSSQLVLTLTEYLDSGGKYDASARVLSVHRSTLKYRLRRIREVSGHDLGLPDTQFNLHFAARAWRTLQALRQH